MDGWERFIWTCVCVWRKILQRPHFRFFELSHKQVLCFRIWLSARILLIYDHRLLCCWVLMENPGLDFLGRFLGILFRFWAIFGAFSTAFKHLNPLQVLDREKHGGSKLDNDVVVHLVGHCFVKGSNSFGCKLVHIFKAQINLEDDHDCD